MIFRPILRAFLLPCLVASFSFLPALSQSVTVSAASLTYENQAQGTSSSVHKVTLTNGQTSAITLSSISTNLADYFETNNCPLSPATLAAGATCTISITFTPSAQGTRDATLTVVDAGLSNPQLITLNGKGTGPILESISVTPVTASVIVADTQQFTATGTYSDGSTKNLTTTASWTSSSTSTATVGVHTGLAKGVAAGTATITATSAKISGSATLTVSAAVLTSIAVTPSTPSVAAGKTQQFTATGTYNNGTTKNLTSTATWTSSTTSIATVSSSGLATSIAQGTATITATSGTISGSATLTVTAAVLTSMAVTPSTASIGVSSTQQFTATGTYSNGTTQNLTTTASWTSSATSIATIKIHTGVATGVSAGTATISASLGTVHGTATLTVTTTVLTSISVTPSPASVAAGNTQQFTATGNYSNGTTQNLTTTATWTSSNLSVATVASGGLSTAIAQGTTTITASSGTISGSATLTVTPPALISISITPASTSIAKGTAQQFAATGNYSDGSTQVLTNTVTWSSSLTSVATVTAGGLATGTGVGASTISATSGTITGTAVINVAAAVLVSIAVTPANPSFALGTTSPLTATGTYSDGSTLNITNSATWGSANTNVAIVSAQGITTSIALGSASITATSGTTTGSTTVTVTAATLISIAVTPAIPTIPLGASQQFTATGTFTDGSTQNITGTVEWSSGTQTVATITTEGLATGLGQGAATITAESGSVTGSTTLTVTSVTLVSIAITPAVTSIAMGTIQQFTATGNYSDGSTQNLTGTVQWSSSTPTVATINSAGTGAGLATSLGQGLTTITASSGSIPGSTTLTVTSATLVAIAINPSSVAVAPGTTQQFTATGTFTDGTTQDLTQSGDWSSTVATVATISDTTVTAGLASTLGAGTTTINITAGSVSGSATMAVNPVTLVSIAINPQNPTIILGMTEQFTATGTFTDGSTQDLTSVTIWTSSAATVATVGNAVGSYGLATSSGQGAATISATSDSINTSTTLAVTTTSPTLLSITVTPLTASIPLGTGQQFTATGNYSNGSTQNLTSAVTWTSTVPSVASVSNSAGTQGLVSAVSSGTSSITATYGSLTGSTSLTVTAAALVSISLSPQSPTISLATNQQFTATGTYTDGSTQTLTNSVTWSSDIQAVATISNSTGSQGLATSVGVGTATISASEGSVSSSTELTVVPLAAPQTWTLHGPPGRRSHSAVYDPISQQMIIFGGQQTPTNTNLNDVWLGITSTTLSDSFTAESPSGTAPQARYGHVASYDSVNNRMMIFGGNLGPSSCGNDVWILSGANGQNGTPAWSSTTASGVPPVPRVYADGVYDPNTNSLIVFGGNDCTSNYFNDVWVLSNANGLSGAPTWTELIPSGTAPPARESSTAVYDSTNNILMVYGGDAGGSPFGDFWVLSNANGTGGTPVWTQLLPTGTAPASRTGHTAVFDSVNDRMTIFGGTTSGGTTLSDAWVLTTANGIGGTPGWILIPAQGTAPSLAYHTAVFDSARDNMYVFAGISSQDKLQANNHAFTLDGANGISSTGEKWFLGGPAVRYSHSAFYDASTNALFVFAGQHSSINVNFNDYWMESPAIGSSNIQWTVVTSKGSKPSARFGHTGLYDSGSGRMMVFAGATGFPAPCVNDYYVLEQATAQDGTWLSITPAGTAPPVRTRHASVYDSSTNTLIIFGGYNCSSTYYNDVWILSDANDLNGQPTWIQLQPTGGPPSVRESSSAIYDPTTNSLIVYGGDSGGEPVGDIWILSNANGSGGAPVWTQLNPANGGPVPRSGHTATYDSQNNIMTIYGGFDGTNILGDAWVLSGANGQAGSAIWTQLPSGQVRRFHTSEYDPVSDQMITYGGASGVTPQDPSSDVYTMTDANNVP
jgi:uncharacterized protein YjdB